MPIRKPHSGNRRPKSKSQHDRILIICNAQCSEPYYIRGLLEHHNINTAGVEVQGYAVTPEVLIKKALEIVKDEIKNGEKYDEVYCVFDRDDFAHYEAAKKRAEQYKFVCITSNPSFEYWLLIHFKETDAPYAAVGNHTVGDLCMSQLKREFKDYKKNLPNLYTALLPRLPNAMKYGQRRYEAAKADNEYNPSTNFHILVQRLHKVAEQKLAAR